MGSVTRGMVCRLQTGSEKFEEISLCCGVQREVRAREAFP